MLSQLVQSILLMDGDHCCNRTYHSDGDNLNNRGNLIYYQNAGRQEPPEQAPLSSNSSGTYVALAGGPSGLTIYRPLLSIGLRIVGAIGSACPLPTHVTYR
jgi:hypothetical protein